VVTNRIAIREGDRQARRQSIRLGDELSALRRRSGITQAAVGRALGVDRTMISRLERGDPRVGLPIRFRVAAVLGADLRLSAYANSGPLIRDAAQARILEAVLAAVDRRWKRTVEASVPGFDRRSIDLRLDGPADVVLCEVESRVGSLEESIRELHAKRDAVRASLAFDPRAGFPIRAVLILPRTQHHRTIVREHPRTIEAAFPMPSDAISRSLQDIDRPWAGDGILWAPVAGEPLARAVQQRAPDTLRRARPHRLEA
jgi:transcriptional regulator with XRE-family HTH domain